MDRTDPTTVTEENRGLTPPGSPSPAPATRKPARPRATPTRLLFTIAAAFLIVFLFLRTFAVEPFGVPTGSMAPTLIGNHRAVPCPRCGYQVRVSWSAGGDRNGHYVDVPCPNCGKPVNLSHAQDVNGDRLLVDKNIYQLRHPRRWEVAVFHCVSDLSKPYVKRIIGLPGETITIVDGDVYANDVLLRKSLREVRQTRIPVFDMNYSPHIGGWGPRWLVYPPDSDPRLPADAGRAPITADSSVLVGNALVLDAAGSPHIVGIEYRHWNLDEQREEPILSTNSYDGPVRSTSHIYPVRDFILDCDIEIATGATDGSFACRLFDGTDSIAAEVSVGPKSPGRAYLTHDQRGVLSSAHDIRLAPGKKYHVEYAFVDRRATLAVDGKLVTEPAELAPLPRRADPKKGGVTRPVQLGVRGCRVVVRNLRILRDIFYTQAGKHGTQEPARLGRTEYFMLGDNSGNSQDSREWPEPGVPESDFIGKPFLIHQPLRVARFTLGGRERVIQTLDWSRLRWLH